MARLPPVRLAAVLALLLVGVPPGRAAGDKAAGHSEDPGARTIADLIKAGQYEEALGAARERLRSVESSRGADSLEAARAIALVLKAGYWASKPRDPELLDLARRAVAIDERVSGPDAATTAESLEGLATILIARGEAGEARGPCERALAIREQAFGRESLEASASRTWLGIIEEDLGDLHGAAAEYERSLAIQEKLLGPDDLGLANTLNSVASVARQLGDYPRALECRRRCLAIREEFLGPDHPLVAWALHNLANLHADLGEFAKARELYLRALAIREKTEPADHPDLGYSHNSLGLMAYNLGDYATARFEYGRAVAIREKALGSDHALVAATLNNLGNLLDDLGETEEAKGVLARALAIKSKRLGPEHPNTAMTADNLGNVLAELKEFGAAEDLIRRALAAQEKALGADHADVGRSLEYLGWLRHQREDDAGGIPLLERALAIEEKALGSGHYDVGATLTKLAVARSGAGDARSAYPLARRALDIQRQVLGPDHPAVAETLSVVGALQLRLGDLAGSVGTALEAEAIGREHFRLTARHLSQREALGYQRNRALSLDVALAALVRLQGDPGADGLAASVLDGVIRSRALVLDAIATRRRQAAEAKSDEAALRLEALRSAATILARLARRGPDPDHPDRYMVQVRAARESEERAERDLITLSPAEREWSEASRIGLAEVRQALPGRVSLLSYARFSSPGPAGLGAPAAASGAEDGYVAFVTPGPGLGATTAAVPLGSAARIETLVLRWREEAARGAQAPSVTLPHLESGYRKAAAALRRAIWDPLAEHLRGSTMVFVVPDGALSIVNLATLPTGDGRYLVESGPHLQYVSAERDLIAARLPRPSGQGLLVVGGVEYGALPASPERPVSAAGARSALAGPCSPYGSLRFPPLPGTRDEADAVARAWASHAADGGPFAGEVTRLSGARAGATAFRDAAKGKRFLHIATHGFFLDDACSGSAAAPDDPMLLSGLAFAGANQRQGDKAGADDGILTAEEIAATDLSGVEWAVLSACDTGLGEIRRGEGVLGLRRAFEIAGVGTLIMSLWPVRDQDAAEWMRALYETRSERLDSSQAMRRAGIKMIEARRKDGKSTHPGVWGAFVAYGAWP